MTSWDNREVTNEHLLPYVDSSTAPSEVQTALRTLPFERNIFKLVANAPVFFPTFMKLLTCAWSPERALRSTDWQIIVLRTASLLNAPYEWDVNEPVARVFGMTDDHLKCLRSGDLSSRVLFTNRQRLISSVVEELCLKDRVAEDNVQQCKEIFGDQGLMELFFTQTIYAFLARTMNSCKIDFDHPIPGLEDMLRKYNAATIEKEMKYTD
ncbi:hypothetical protein N7481_004940 [Penicillium waksmanii]|uniref:uncharacterized protein n=1 Tax=Penicillium waksmanii TaxID=69791 RepID=UPI0025494C3F|nr:uncharacterized protein N7481_004940 [Penicillium waksmanii]KAJ5982841.1 hypothetical protein N7481_004940 [Penicillium waksmanii]